MLVFDSRARLERSFRLDSEMRTVVAMEKVYIIGYISVNRVLFPII